MNYLGVDIGGTTTKLAIINSSGKILESSSFLMDTTLKQDKLIYDLALNIHEFIKNKNVKSIGIGCPGIINSETGCCDYSANLFWRKADVCKLINKITNLPCYITNDANAAILGEIKFGFANKYKHAILLTLGTGVGAGLYLNGQLYEGNKGKGGEIGHFKLYRDSERKCACGEYGCFEKYASASAIIYEAQKDICNYPTTVLLKLCNNNPKNIDAKMVFDGYHSKDPLCIKVIETYISDLGQGILDLNNIFRPEVIILSGGISRQGEWFEKKITKYIKDRKYGYGGDYNEPVDIKIAKLGADTGVIGAATLAMENSK